MIIGNCSTNVVNTLAANVVRNGLKFCNIIPPNFGYKQHELMQDIAIALGAKYFSEKTGDDLSLINENDLGFANKIIVGKASSVIIRHEQMTEEIEQRIKELKEQQSNTSHPEEKKFINERIASLSGAIGCIYVGGNSDVEQKEKFDRVDDSVCAVKSALEEGIVVGGGLALYNIAKELLKTKYKDKNQSLASTILSQSLVAPFEQILTNAGIDPDTIKLTSKQTYGFDVKNEKYGDMFKMGIIDPLKVTKKCIYKCSQCSNYYPINKCDSNSCKNKSTKINMPIHNYIFDSYREELKKIKEAIELLEKNGYMVYNKDKKYDTNRKVHHYK